MARYNVGAYAYEDDSADRRIYDGMTGIPLTLGCTLVSQERGDTVIVRALGVREERGQTVPFARLRSQCGVDAPEYEVRAVRAPQTGQWVLVGYAGV